MPRFNGSGPLGFGPGTGRGLGNCRAGFGCGGGFAQGRGAGFGRRSMLGVCPYSVSSPKMTKKEEANFLTEESEILENELSAIKERLTQLSKLKD